jgi:hypothetical protein
MLRTKIVFVSFSFVYSGVSANADPHTNKLRTRVTHIWGYRRRQLNRSAMGEPLPGETACMITVFPVPGKYAWVHKESLLEWILWFGETVTISPLSDDFPLYEKTSNFHVYEKTSNRQQKQRFSQSGWVYNGFIAVKSWYFFNLM